jgi:HAE1 family hydrophobic/amphiphilic exporter-1
MAEARQVPGATDVDTSQEKPQAEVRLAVERGAAADLGLDLGTVASTMRGLIAGEVVSQFEDRDGDSYDVRLRVERSERTRAIDLLGLDLPAQGGRALVPASQVVRPEDGFAPSKITRRDLLREVRIAAGTEGRSLGEVVADIKQRTSRLTCPRAIASTTQAIPRK